MTKKLWLVIIFLWLVAFVFGTALEIGTGTDSFRFPLGTNSGYERSAALYTDIELGAQNIRIASLAWYSNTAITIATPTKIYLKRTSATTETALTWENMIAGATLVYNATHTTTVTGGWNTFTLSASYDVDEGSGLYVLVERNYGGEGYGGVYGANIRYTNTASTHQTWLANSTPPLGIGTVDMFRPNITLNYTTYTIIGPPSPAVAVSPAHSATGVLANATLNWLFGGGLPTNYRLYFGTDGGGTSTPTNIVNGTYLGNVLTYDPVSDMDYSTTYYWKIVPNNSFGDTSGCPIWSFTTCPNPAITTLPYTQNFDSVTAPAIPVGWTVINTNGDTEWGIDSEEPLSSPNAMYIYYCGNADDDWLISPPIALSAGTTYQIKYNYRSKSSYREKLKLMVGAAPTAGALSTLLADHVDFNNMTYAENTVSYTPATSGNYYFGWFAYSTAWQWGIYIDDVTVLVEPSGPPTPAILVSPADNATGLSKSGFNLTWTAGLTGNAPTLYTVYISNNPTDMLGQYSFVMSPPLATSFNPVTTGGMTFDYNEKWFWTVRAANASGVADPAVGYNFTIEIDPGVYIPHVENFDSTTMPVRWFQNYEMTLPSNRWSIFPTALAGGSPNELLATPSTGTGESRIVSPPVYTTGITAFNVYFHHFFDDFESGITAKLQYSSDLFTWTDTGWSIESGRGDVGPQTVSVHIAGISSPFTYLSWVLNGNHDKFDSWYVDNVNFLLPPLHDVSPVSIDIPDATTPEVFNPKATFTNYGTGSETFSVQMLVGTTYNSTQTVTALAPGSTRQVTFASMLPWINTAYPVTVRTLLATDGNTLNDSYTFDFVCLNLNTTGYADVSYDPDHVLAGPATFSLKTPGAITDLPAPALNTKNIGGADFIENEWFGAEYDNGLLTTDNYWKINPVTGEMLLCGQTEDVITGIAYNAYTNVLYGTDGQNLFTLNRFNGYADFVGAHATGGIMIGLACDHANNILYGIDIGKDALYIIEPSTGSATKVGNLGIDINYAQDCAFDQDNGYLFLAGYTERGGGVLYWIDTLTGGAYKINNFQSNAELDGFAIPYTSYSPAVTIAEDGNLNWDAIPSGVSYNVYSADDPYGAFTYRANTSATTWLDPLFPELKKFYKVTTVKGAKSRSTTINYLKPRHPVTGRHPATVDVMHME